MSLQNSLSQADQAFFDTLITKAEDYAFDQLAEMYGVRRHSNVAIKYWRKALQHVALGPRGAPGSTFGFVREALRQYDAAYTVQVDPQPTKRHKMYWASGGPVAGFRFQDLYRLWEIDGGVYFSVGWRAGGAEPGAPWPYIELAQYPGYGWKGCDWATFPTLTSGVFTNKNATKLPFVYRPSGATYQLYVDGFSSTTPPTYMQDAYIWQVLYANATPGVGNTWFPTRADQVGAIEALSAPYTGTLPAAAGETATYCSWVAESTATLTRLDVAADADELAAPARGGNYTFTLRINGVDTALTATLGAAATAASGVGAVAVAVGDKVSIKVVAGAGVTQPLLHLVCQASSARPVGQPKGGAVLSDATVKGDQVDGPFPWYLIDDGLAEWNATLELLLAAGVVPIVKTFNFATPW